MEANAIFKAIVRKDTAEKDRQMLFRMAPESGIEAPPTEELTGMDKKSKGKKLSNQDCASPVNPDAKVARMKHGRTRLGYKPEHAVYLHNAVIIPAAVHAEDSGDTATLEKTLDEPGPKLHQTTPAPSCPDDPAELSADKRYHSHKVSQNTGETGKLEAAPWKTRIAEPKTNG